MVTTTDSIGGAPTPPANGSSVPRHEVPENDQTPTRVEMRAKITGTRNGVDWPEVGDVIEVPASEAAALIRQFNAIPAPEQVVEVATEPEPEAAVIEPLAERAIEPISKPRPRGAKE
jgi:hypothetical protein